MSINTDWCKAKDPLGAETTMQMADKYDLRKRDDLLAFVFDILDYQNARSAYLCETLAAEHPDGADLFMMASNRILSTPLIPEDEE